MTAAHDCRLRQLGQKEVAKQVEGSIGGQDAIASAIADIGTKAAGSGFTTAQVRSAQLALLLQGRVASR